MLQTEFPFILPHGYIDASGTVHREGAMRTATAIDEIAPLKDARVKSNPGYLLILLLSRVITKLGEVESISPKVIESLVSGDLCYLQDLYRRINRVGQNRVTVTCPHCQRSFEMELDR
jgi:hypothetical protein